MYMPVQIQLKTVKMVEIEPESDVPAAAAAAARAGQARGAVVAERRDVAGARESRAVPDVQRVGDQVAVVRPLRLKTRENRDIDESWTFTPGCKHHSASGWEWFQHRIESTNRQPRRTGRQVERTKWHVWSGECS